MLTLFFIFSQFGQAGQNVEMRKASFSLEGVQSNSDSGRFSINPIRVPTDNSPRGES